MSARRKVPSPERRPKKGVRSSGQPHGVVLTKPHIVDLILDLSGYTVDRDLAGLSLLEPSCGHGAFLTQAVERLLEAARRSGRAPSTLGSAILAFDIDPEHVARTRDALRRILSANGVDENTALRLAAGWVREGDFLLAPLDRAFEIIVGNPPFIRIEELPRALQSMYRRRYSSLFDRADLYVAFIERALSLLSPEGILSFICADRWISNRYGAPLRKLVSERHRVRCYIDLHDASPFESEVIAYPSIFAMSHGTSENVPVVRLKTASEEECKAVGAALSGRASALPEGVTAHVHAAWFQGDEPWVLGSPDCINTLRSLESRFAPIEKTARVGIGVATGSDKVYIVGRDADIEPDRLVPLVMRDDIERGCIRSSARFVINTFDEGGRPVDLDKYPRLMSYLARHSPTIKRRHIARRNPGAWFRTIDRVAPHLVRTPKLLIPDIAGSNEVAFDEGRFHPHHNLYFITSEEWDLEVLGGLLSSKVALFFVWSYAVKMRGGYLRFQAQYLRRIRLPEPGALAPELASGLKVAFRERAWARIDELALQCYGLGSLPAFDFVDTRA